jgi:hypothetical protein
LGIGNASDSTWNSIGVLGYDLTKHSSLWLGYRALGGEYKTGKAADEMKFDLTISGQVLSEDFRF